MTPFDHINAIFTNQKVDYWDNLEDADKKQFNAFIINRGISMNPNFIPIVNIAQRLGLTGRELYLFYSQILPKGKQYNKWVKSTKEKHDYESWMVDLIAKHFECSKTECIDYLNILYKDDDGKKYLYELLKKYGIELKRLKKLKLVQL